MQRTKTGKFRSQPRDPLTNRRISITGQTPSEVAARLHRVHEIRTDLALGADPTEAARRLRPAAGRVLTLGDAWRRYEATLSPRRRVKADENWRRYIKPFLTPETRLWELTEERLARWLVELETNSGAKAIATRAVAYDYLSAAVGLLVPRELVSVPWSDWRPPRPSADDTMLAAARTAEELESLVRVAQEYETAHPRSVVARAILADVFLGARSAELAGLGWDCVDLENGVVHIRYQAPRDWRRWCDRRPTLPRKGGKPLVVRLNPLAARVLELQRAELQRLGYYRHDGPVFPGLRGEWRTSGAVIKSSLLRQLAAIAGIPDWRRWRAHSLRHTTGTLGFLATGDLRAIQAILGHSDLKMTQRYSHFAGRGLPMLALPPMQLELPELPPPPPAPQLVEHVEESPPEVSVDAEDTDAVLTFPELARRWLAARFHRGPRPTQVTDAARHAYVRAYNRTLYREKSKEEARAEGRKAKGRVLGAWAAALARAKRQPPA